MLTIYISMYTHIILYILYIMLQFKKKKRCAEIFKRNGVPNLFFFQL